MGLDPGGLDNHKDYIRDLIEKVNSCKLLLRIKTHCATVQL